MNHGQHHRCFSGLFRTSEALERSRGIIIVTVTMFILEILYTSLYLLLSISSSAAQNECEQKCNGLIAAKTNLNTKLAELTFEDDVKQNCKVYGEMMTCLRDHCGPDALPTPAENMSDYRTYINVLVAKYTGVMSRCSDPRALTDLNICRRSERFKAAVKNCAEEPEDWSNATEHGAEGIKSFCSDEQKSLECRILHARTICTHNATNLWINSTRAGFQKLVQVNGLDGATPQNCTWLSAFLDEALKNECKQNCDGFIAKKNGLGTYLSNLTDVVDVERSCSVYGEMVTCLNNPESNCIPDAMPPPAEGESDYRIYVKINVAKYTGVMSRCSDPRALTQLNICRRSERFKAAVKNCTEEPNDWKNATEHGAEGIKSFCSDEQNSMECRIELARNICTSDATNLWIESTRAGFKKLIEINKLDVANLVSCKKLFDYLDNKLPVNTPSPTNSTAPGGGVHIGGLNFTAKYRPKATSEETSMGIKHTSEHVLAIGLIALANLVVSNLGLWALQA